MAISIALPRSEIGRGLELVIGKNVEGKLEALVELILPLLCEASGTDYEATLKITSDNQLFNKEPCHYGLACPRVVGEQKPQRSLSAVVA